MVGRPFQKGQSGNPSGKPRGCRNRASRVVEHLFEGEARELAKVAVTLAKSGDGPVLRAVLDRIAPARRDRLVTFALPRIETAEDLGKATATLIQAVADGVISPSEAGELSKLFELHTRAMEASDIGSRLAALEQASAAVPGVGRP